MQEKSGEDNRSLVMRLYGTFLREVDDGTGVENNGCLQEIEGHKRNQYNQQSVAGQLNRFRDKVDQGYGNESSGGKGINIMGVLDG